MERSPLLDAGLLAVTLAVYLFMLAPVGVIIILSFNTSEYSGFPMAGVTLKWFGELFRDPAILDALKVSMGLGLGSALISTVIGTLAAYAIARFEFPGRRTAQVLLTLPILVPHLILGVGLLLGFRFLGLSRSFGLLLAGHVALVLPYVVMTTLHRFQSIPANLEEAAQTLGAGRLKTFLTVSLPLAAPAIVSGGLLAFISSFDEVTATLFWRPTGIETLPTQVMAMMQYSIDQRLNALGAVMTALSVAVPLGCALLMRALSRRTQSAESGGTHV